MSRSPRGARTEAPLARGVPNGNTRAPPRTPRGALPLRTPPRQGLGCRLFGVFEEGGPTRTLIRRGWPPFFKHPNQMGPGPPPWWGRGAKPPRGLGQRPSASRRHPAGSLPHRAQRRRGAGDVRGGVIPTDLTIDRCPFTRPNRLNTFWIVDQKLPSGSAGLDDRIISVPNEAA